MQASVSARPPCKKLFCDHQFLDRTKDINGFQCIRFKCFEQFFKGNMFGMEKSGVFSGELI